MKMAEYQYIFWGECVIIAKARLKSLSRLMSRRALIHYSPLVLKGLTAARNKHSNTFRKKIKHLISCASTLVFTAKSIGNSDLSGTEREGFEPSTEVASCNSLAGSRFQPLSHLSSSKTIVPRGLPNAQITRRGKRCLKLQSTSHGIESASSAQDLGLIVCSSSRPSRVTTSPLSKPW